MREASGKPAAESKGDSRFRMRAGNCLGALSRISARLTIFLAMGITKGRHKASVIGGAESGNESEVPIFRYSRTTVCEGQFCAATANSTSLLVDCGLRTIVGLTRDAENGNCQQGT